MTDWHNLAAALHGIPDLDDAACVGMWAAFDPAEPDENTDDIEYRHNAALALCKACPALPDCSAWFDSLKPSQRPPGVVAGRVTAPRRPGRPRRAAS